MRGCMQLKPNVEQMTLQDELKCRAKGRIKGRMTAKAKNRNTARGKPTKRGYNQRARIETKDGPTSSRTNDALLTNYFVKEEIRIRVKDRFRTNQATIKTELKGLDKKRTAAEAKIGNTVRDKAIMGGYN